MSSTHAAILIVDDRPENLLALEAILESLPCQVVRALSGAEALKALLRHDFALILLDVQMPVLDGFETAALIKERERSRHIPIIFVTAISKEQSYVFQGYSAGAVDYISKPFDPEILKSKAAVFLELWEQNERIKRQEAALNEARARELEAHAREREREAEQRHLAQLATSEARFRRVVESNMMGVLFGDMEGRISDANDAFLEMVGYSRADLESGRVDWAKMTPPEWAHLDENSQMQLRESGVMTPFEKEYIRKDGSRLPVILGAALMEDSAEEFVAWVVDIAKRKRAETLLHEAFGELRAAHDDLQRAEGMRDSLTQMLVHDLRTPLTTMLLSLDMLQTMTEDSTDFDEMQREMIELALRGSNQLLALVNDLLDIAKMEDGELKIERETVAIAELIEGARQSVASQLQMANVELRRNIAPDAVSVDADADLLRRVLVNLVGNAIKFTPRDGAIEIGARNEPDGWEFWVRDDGPGIAPEHQERIFEKFGQVEMRKQGNRPSSGLGLTFCRLAVEAHGGRIWVESALGQGSTFRFTLVAPAR